MQKHIGYKFRKSSWPEEAYLLIENTNFTQAVIEAAEKISWNFKPFTEVCCSIQEKYIIEKAYERKTNDMLSSTNQTK